jgi:hypothetical protein
MDILAPTVLIYLLLGAGVAVAVFLADAGKSHGSRWFNVLAALPFWPLYVPLLLAGKPASSETPQHGPHPPPTDDMAAAIRQVDAELEAALGSLDGWAEGVRTRELDRIHALRNAWTTQAERIREMDRLLAQPEPAANGQVLSNGLSPTADERVRRIREARRQNLERLREVRQRAYDKLLGNLAWVRELVSMIHLAKFTGEPASRAEELVAQMAAAVEGISAPPWRAEDRAASGDRT